MRWGLQSGGLETGSLQSRATDFGSRNVLIVIALGPTVWEPSLAQPILDLATYSLHWGLQSGSVQSGGLNTLAHPILGLATYSLHWGLQFGGL